MDATDETRFNFIIVKGSSMKEKTKTVVATTFIFACLCIDVRAQIPIDPQNRIVDGKIYNPQKSALWINVSRDVTERCSKLEVTSIGKISISCDVYRTVLDDGGRYSVFRVIGEKYVKTILIYNHPAHDSMTTGTVIRPGHAEIYNHPARDAMIYAPREEKSVTTPTTKPFLAMRVANWRTNNMVFEAYDCGLPDTIENREKAGISVPTAADLDKLTQKELATRAAAQKAIDDRKKAKEDKVLKWNMDEAEKGNAFGLLRMGERYRDGNGVPKDLNKAREYFNKASAAGSPTATDALSRLNQSLTNSPATKP